MTVDGCARFLADHGKEAWHVAEAEGVPGLLAGGLLPAGEIRRRQGVEPGRFRADFDVVPLGSGPAVLRFQQMRDAQLTPWLRGRFTGRPDLWRAHVDEHVFFWLCPRRRDAFVDATRRERRRSWRAAGLGGPPPEPVVLRFDLAALLERHGAIARASLINSGSMVLGKTWRDEATFRPVAEWDGTWATPGGARRPRAAELAIAGSVPAPLPLLP